MVDLQPGQGPRLALQLSGRDEGLAVSVVESPVGEAEAAHIVLQRIDDVLRMVSQPTFHADVGRGLFRALFPEPLREIYHAAAVQAALAGQPLMLELRFDRDLVRVARYPWELLHDGTRFLLQSGAVNLARYLRFPEPPRPLTAHHPMDVLVIASSPADQPPLTSDFAGMESAFLPLIRDDQLDLAYLIPPTWDSMMDWLLAGAPSVLHFEGHGAFSRTGMLVFENADRASDPVDAQTLGAAFYGTDLRLAVLSACETATAGSESLLGSVAPTLILAGIPAVVAMQQHLPDEDAVRFSRGFYTALLAGKDIESAMAAGRKQLVRTTYWYVPTLYLRTHHVPEIRQAYLQRRVDTAAPRSAAANFPLRFGVWICRTESPQPGEDELRRLLGLEMGDDVSRDSSPASLRFPVEMGQIRPGTVDVRLVAPGCDVHTNAVRRVPVLPDFDTPPLWFALTPRRTGRLDIIVEITQDDMVVASLAHTIRVTAGAEGAPVASIVSHGEDGSPGGEESDAGTVVTPTDEVPAGASEPALDSAPTADPDLIQPREEPDGEWGPPVERVPAPEPDVFQPPVAPFDEWEEPVAPPETIHEPPSGDDWIETIPDLVDPLDESVPVVLGESNREDALDTLMREIVTQTASMPDAPSSRRRTAWLLIALLVVIVVALLAVYFNVL